MYGKGRNLLFAPVFGCENYKRSWQPCIFKFSVESVLEDMMPFGKMGAKALEKIKDLDIAIIAPSHGPIYKNPQRILEPYAKWTAGETENKALIVYVSMWGSTKLMVRTIAETLLKEGVDVRIYDLEVANTGDIARELVDSRAVILGAPTVLAGMRTLEKSYLKLL